MVRNQSSSFELGIGKRELGIRGSWFGIKQSNKSLGRAEHVERVDASRWGKGKGFLGMGRTKGTKVSKGTKGRFTGASREGSGNRFPIPNSRFGF